jgi:hypothetical protein
VTGVTFVSIPAGNRGAVWSREADFANQRFGRRRETAQFLGDLQPTVSSLPGYHLSLLVSADGTAYSISLRATDSNGCGVSLFSDQSGLIYQGTPLDRPKIVDWPQYPW